MSNKKEYKVSSNGGKGIKNNVEISHELSKFWGFVAQDLKELKVQSHNENIQAQLTVLEEWFRNEGNKLKVKQTSANMNNVKNSRRADLIRVLKNFNNRMERKRNSKSEVQSYVDWIFEAPLILEDKLEAFEVYNQIDYFFHEDAKADLAGMGIPYAQSYNQRSSVNLYHVGFPLSL